jgi:hypothetical protein
MYLHLTWQDSQKFTQISIFGLKSSHLATLVWQEKRQSQAVITCRKRIFCIDAKVDENNGPSSSSVSGEKKNRKVFLNQLFFVVLGGHYRRWEQDCQIFLGTTYQNGKSIPNNHKIYQMATKYSK